MSTSRRGLFGWLMGGVAVAAFPEIVVPQAQAWSDTITFTEPAVLSASELSAELFAITRKAFIPRVYVQLYQAHPFLSLTMADRDSPETN